MKRSSKLTAFLATVLCLALVLGGCGGGQGAVKSDLKLSGVNEFPITEEKVNLSIFAVKNPYIEDFATNDFTKLLEEKTNVHLEWNVATGDTRQAFNLMLASGSYNDIVMEMGLKKTEMLSYSQQGILTDLKPYIEEHGHYIKEMFEETPAIPEALTINGGIYGLPKVTEGYRYAHRAKMWVYKPWLEKLGIEIPQTTEEFYQMLKRFKEEDPNGNGIADELPLVARGVKDNYGIEPFLMSAFQPVGALSRVYVDDDGKVQYAAVQPEYREGLRYIKKLYDEELLYKDTFILDRSQIMTIGENDPVIMGAGPGMFPGMFTISNGNEERYYEYTAIPPLEGPKGVRVSVNDEMGYTGNFVVTSACKYPDVAVKWVDWLYSAEGKRLSQATTSAVAELRPAKEGELAVTGKQAVWAKDKTENTATEDTGMTHNRSWQKFGVWYSNFESSINVCNYNDILDKHGEWYKAYEAHEQYAANNFIKDLAIAEEDIAEYTDISTALQNVEVSFASFVVGDLSLDDDWDKYVDELNALGLPRYLEIMQKAYDLSKK